MKTGDTWRGWTIDSLIGEGSFGKVYKIVKKEFGHTYSSALKVIRVPQSSAEIEALKNEGMNEADIAAYYKGLVEDISSEIALLSRLKGNSNIVSYEDHEVVKLDDKFGWEIYIRMELLTPLYKYIEEHPLTEKDTVKMGVDICKALEVCRKFSIIHRDIKTENIFVSEQGYFKLGDFGIAKQMDKASAALSKKGTTAYMAPEVYRAEPYDPSIDLYSLGIVLYRFVNDGRTPFLPPAPQPIRFRDIEAATAKRMKGHKIPPPCNAQDKLSKIILKACAYDPKDRYDSAAAMRKDLEALYPGELDAEEKARRAVTLKKKRRRLLAAALAILVLCAGVYAYTERDKTTVPSVTGINEEEAQAAVESADLVYVEERVFSEEAEQGMVIKQSVDAKARVKKGTEITMTVSAGIPVETPDVIKKTIPTAENIAEEVGLSVEKIGEEYSATVSNLIISQEPAAGDPCEKGQPIKVVVSLGPEQVEVPNVVGMNKDEAREKAIAAGFVWKAVPKKSSEKAGTVIWQSLEPGKTYERDTRLMVYVSDGSGAEEDEGENGD